MTAAELTSILTKDTHIPRLHARAVGVFCEYFGENWPSYYGTALYHVIHLYKKCKGVAEAHNCILNTVPYAALVVEYMFSTPGLL